MPVPNDSFPSGKHSSSSKTTPLQQDQSIGIRTKESLKSLDELADDILKISGPESKAIFLLEIKKSIRRLREEFWYIHPNDSEARRAIAVRFKVLNSISSKIYGGKS